MTKLTPLSAEQCALIDEAARQQKTGEYDAGYWYWFCNGSEKTHVKYYFDTQYHPAPAHPHYATYCEWQRLVDAGEVAKGWWDIISTNGVCYAATLEPKWLPDCEYEIRKNDKHPNNRKPALKMINWANIPVGAMTKKGEFLGFHESTIHGRYSAVLLKKMALISSELYSLRLAEQTKFSHLQDGEAPPVIEGVVIEYEYVQCGPDKIPSRWVVKTVQTFGSCLPVAMCIGYRIIGLADGWTDDPSKAAV